MEENEHDHSGLIDNELQNLYAEGRNAEIADEHIVQISPLNQSQENCYKNKQMDEMRRSLDMLGNTISDLNKQFQNKMGSLETDLCQVKSRISIIQNPDSEIEFNYNRNENRVLENTPPTIVSASSNNRFDQDSYTPESRRQKVKQNNLKMKPQSYNGSEDLDDFLTQFEITAEINCWGYKEKSLYLASTLTSEARSLLSEMNDRERRDFDSLVEKLKARFGSENKAEVYRTQLKTRVRNRGETIQELAQSIRKMTRQAYPTGSQDVVEALALDNFIDALTESEIRLRLREVAPKNIFEAEKMAVRMEAHRLADRQRTKLVGNVAEFRENETQYPNKPSYPNNKQSNPNHKPTNQNVFRPQYQSGQNNYRSESYRNTNQVNNPREQYGNRKWDYRSREGTFGEYNNNGYTQFPRQNWRNDSRAEGHRFEQRPPTSSYEHRNNQQGNFYRSNQRDQGLTNQTGPKLH